MPVDCRVSATISPYLLSSENFFKLQHVIKTMYFVYPETHKFCYILEELSEDQSLVIWCNVNLECEVLTTLSALARACAGVRACVCVKIIWDDVPCNLVNKVPTLVPVCQTTWHIIPEESWCKNCYAVLHSLCKFTSSYVRLHQIPVTKLNILSKKVMWIYYWGFVDWVSVVFVISVAVIEFCFRG